MQSIPGHDFVHFSLASGSLPNPSSWSQMDGNAGSSRTSVPHYGSTLFGGTKNDRPLFGNQNHMSSSSSSSWQDLLRPMSSSLLSRHDDIPLLTYELLNPPVDNTILFRITNEGDPSKGENAKWKITPYLNPNANKNKNTNSDLTRNNIRIGAKNTLHDVTVLPSTVPNPNAYFTPGMGMGMQQGQHEAVVGTNFNNQTSGSRLPETSYTPATNTSSWDDILAAATACLTGPGPALATPQMGPGQHFQAPAGNQGMKSWQPYPHVQAVNYVPGPQQFQAPPQNVAATVGQDRESWQPHVQTENYEPGPQQFQAPPGNVTATIGQDMESWQPQVQTQNYRPGPQQLQTTPRNVTATMGQDRESWQPQVQIENYGPGTQQFQAPPGNVAATGATTSQDKESWQPQVHPENNGPGPMDTTDIDDFINFDAMMNYWSECDLDQYEKFGSDI
ncbi:hypothetical protein DM860_010535 [Cuscuta australis]|uniref:Uncharacterized protein n=1 Tax=Cuscuta australis TaxID=267555 RepID=A0A328E1S0_9ASTE|nr:hypothetical protein DM860_010535 [Cuscuta australis]